MEMNICHSYDAIPAQKLCQPLQQVNFKTKKMEDAGVICTPHEVNKHIHNQAKTCSQLLYPQTEMYVPSPPPHITKDIHKFIPNVQRILRPIPESPTNIYVYQQTTTLFITFAETVSTKLKQQFLCNLHSLLSNNTAVFNIPLEHASSVVFSHPIYLSVSPRWLAKTKDTTTVLQPDDKQDVDFFSNVNFSILINCSTCLCDDEFIVSVLADAIRQIILAIGDSSLNYSTVGRVLAFYRHK